MFVSLVDLYLDTGLQQWCYPAHAQFPAYLARLTQHVQIEQSLPEQFFGVLPEQRASIRGSNVYVGNPTVSSLAAQTRLHNRRARIQVWDTESGTAFLSLDGVITDVQIETESFTLTVSTRQGAAFQELVPKKTLLDLYPGADLSNAGSRDLGVLVPFGTLLKAPLHLVRSDATLSQYDYGVIRKPATGTLSIAAAYRVDRVIPAAEYALVESPTGYYVLRFTRPQRTRQGTLEQIRVTLVSTEFSSHADVVSEWLFKEELGLSVTSASLTTARAALSSLGLLPGGGLIERRRAGEVLEALTVHGMTVERTLNADYDVRVDTLASHPTAPVALGQGDTDWNNLSIAGETAPALDQSPRAFVQQGLFDAGFSGAGAYKLKASRALDGEGTPLEDANPFLGDFASIDRQADYRAKRLRYSQRRLTGRVQAADGRLLALHQQISVYVPNLFHNADLWEVAGITFDGALAVSLRGFDPAIFAYTADPTVTPPPDIALVDYTRTFPGTVTGFAVINQFTRAAVDQTIEAVFVLSATAPLVNASHLVFRAVRAGSAIYLPAIQVPVSVGAQATVELAVGSGLPYDLQCFARNTANNDGSQDGPITQLLAQTAPTDTTVLAAPQNFTVQASEGELIRVFADPPTGDEMKRFGHYEFWTSSTNDINTAVKLAEKRGNEFVTGNQAIGVQKYAWLRKVNSSGVAGAFTASVAFTPAKIVASHIDDEVSGGATETARRVMRKATLTGVAPSATTNTLGPATDINPGSGYTRLAGIFHASLTSGGTFGVETLTVRITATFSDGTTAFVEKTFTGGGQETALASADVFVLMKDSVSVNKYAIQAKSDLASSSATAGAKFGGFNA